MKNLFYLIFSLGLISAIAISCQEENHVSNCNPELDETKYYANQTGTLYYTDSIAGLRLFEFNYVILSDISNLPLIVCNADEVDYSISQYQSLNISFSAHVETLSPFADAFVLRLELVSIGINETKE